MLLGIGHLGGVDVVAVQAHVIDEVRACAAQKLRTCHREGPNMRLGATFNQLVATAVVT